MSLRDSQVFWKHQNIIQDNVVELGATDPSTVRQTSNLEWYDEMIYI